MPPSVRSFEIRDVSLCRETCDMVRAIVDRDRGHARALPKPAPRSNAVDGTHDIAQLILDVIDMTC